MIRQTVARNPEFKLLVVGASNLAVDNLMMRLAKHKVPLTRIGHPARVLPGMLDHTLDVQSLRTNAYDVLRDLRSEIDQNLNKLRIGGRRRIRGKERAEVWQATRELRKDLVKREAKVTKEVLDAVQVVLATCHGCACSCSYWPIMLIVLTTERAPACYVTASSILSSSTKQQLPSSPHAGYQYFRPAV